MTLKEWWKAARKCGRVYWVADHISRSNMGAYYTLYTISRGELVKAWPSSGTPADHGYDEKLAKRLGFRIGRHDASTAVGRLRGWYRGGCGYNRPFDVVDSIAREVGQKVPHGSEKHWSRKVSIEGLGDG